MSYEKDFNAKLKPILENFQGIEYDSVANRLQVAIDDLATLLKILHDSASTWFDHLSCLTAIDLGAEIQPRFKLVYNLVSYPHEQQVEVVSFARLYENNWYAPSVGQLWPTAYWHEREIFDLFGIYFEGNPDLRRIFMPEDWPGHPLRRDYVVPEYYHGIAVGYYDPSPPNESI